MKTIFGNKSRIISQVTLVVLCILLIIFFMPREISFEYDFEKDAPWEHEQIIADFDFVVKKSDRQIAAENDSVKENFKPYFTYDKELGGTMYREMYNMFRNMTLGYTPTQIGSSFRQYLNCLSTLYRHGIIADSDTATVGGRKNSSINVIDGNRIIETDAANFICETEALRLLQNCDTVFNGKLQNLRSYIKPNYVCDTTRTATELESELGRVGTTLAIIQKGERIVNKGDIVDDKLYTTIETYLNEAKKVKELKEGDNKLYIFIGQVMFIVIAMLTLLTYIYIYRSDIAHSANKFTFVILSAALFPILVGIMQSTTGTSVFILPFAIMPMMLCLFVDHATAFTTNIITIVICSIMVNSPYEFVLLQTMAGSSAILSLKELSSRSQMFRCVLTTFLTYAIVYLCYELITEPDFSKLNLRMYIYFVISAVLMLFVYPAMFLIEKTFGFISNVTLIELSNLNSKLLQRMSQEAPGTFQHSMQVGNLAAEAARAIGANSLEVRTGALYHDLGKMENPIYFTENQNGGINPHDMYAAEESAQIIINHVRDGIALAEKAGLPKKIKAFITTHHGLSKTGYFYITYKNSHPGENIDERLFTYPGPRPTTKEQAILMLADSVEAASHSIKEYTEKSISELVDKLINQKLADGDLSQSPLTFQEVDTIRELFKKRLMAIYHTRISYPSEKKKEGTEGTEDAENKEREKQE